MDAVLHKIQRSEAEEFLRNAAPMVRDILALTSMFYGGYAGGKLVLVAGIVIENLLADEAYLWMQGDQEAIGRIPITFARMARDFVQELPYLIIRGHTTEPFANFIRWLGGDLIDTTINSLIPFEIRKQLNG